MKLPGRKFLLVAGAAALLALIALIAVVADQTGLAVLCGIGVQGVVLLAVLDLGRAQRRLDAQTGRHTKALGRIDRQIANLGVRSVTEARATERSIRSRISKSDGLTQSRLQAVQRHLDRRGDEHVQDIEALIQLFGRISPRAAMPSSGRWALEPTGLLRLVDLVESTQVRTVVELGSGTSTLWLAYALEKRGTGGQIISIEHDPHVAAQTRAALRAHGFAEEIAEVRDAPLVDDVVAGHDTTSYDPKSYADVSDIDVLIVDGPPEGTGEGATHPAVPALLDRLAPRAIVVVDDTRGDDESRMVQRWLEAEPRLRTLDDSGSARQVFLTLD